MHDEVTGGDEWRVEVEIGEEGGASPGSRLAAERLDDEAQAELGGRVIVTRDGAHLFAYAGSEGLVRAAESQIRKLLEAEGLEADVRVTRWHPVEEAWKDAS